jgi:hypothetical protein
VPAQPSIPEVPSVLVTILLVVTVLAVAIGNYKVYLLKWIRIIMWKIEFLKQCKQVP